MGDGLSGANVLLTGATGFIGSHCLERLVAAGSNIYAVNRTGTGPTALGVNWIAADLRDPEAVKALVRATGPTHVLHTAWNVTHGEFWHAPDNLDWLEAGLTLLRSLSQTPTVRFVGVGTCAEYDWSGESVECVEDVTPVRPDTLYGKAKAAFWAAAQAVGAQAGYSVAWGRLFTPYGPGDNGQRLIPSLVRSLRDGRPFSMNKQALERDFIFASDVGDLLVRMLQSDTGGAFNVSSGNAVRLGDVAKYIAGRLGRLDLLTCQMTESGGHEPHRLVGISDKVHKAFDWQPSVELNKGLDHVLAAV
ncbi:MAG: NAD(P)-dependent oxidoreductase [Pseudomonadota bacterium]